MSRIITRQERRENQCDEKLRYVSEDRALKYAQRYADAWERDYFVYACEFCSGFHLTTKMIPPTARTPYPSPTAVVTPRRHRVDAKRHEVRDSKSNATKAAKIQGFRRTS